MTRSSVILLSLLMTVAVPAAAQQDFSNVEIETVRVAHGLYALIGSGGNVA
jgi:hypothetical protein